MALSAQNVGTWSQKYTFYIITCVVLHNICQENNENLREEDQELLRQVIIQERAARQNNDNNNICNDFNNQRVILTQYLQNL